MTKKFAPGLDQAWFQYQDLYDRYMSLLRDVGEAASLDDLQTYYEDKIDYAMNDWSTAQERFETGGYNDFDLGLDDEDKYLHDDGFQDQMEPQMTKDKVICPYCWGELKPSQYRIFKDGVGEICRDCGISKNLRFAGYAGFFLFGFVIGSAILGILLMVTS